MNRVGYVSTCQMYASSNNFEFNGLENNWGMVCL